MIPYSEQAIVAQTVLLEAENEPWEAKLAVAQVIVNRMYQRKQSAYEVCWQPWQFPCWQESLDKVAKRFTNATTSTKEESWRAAEFAQQLSGENDITEGATHYLPQSEHPAWVEKMKLTVTRGTLSFYKEVA